MGDGLGFTQQRYEDNDIWFSWPTRQEYHWSKIEILIRTIDWTPMIIRSWILKHEELLFRNFSYSYF